MKLPEHILDICLQRLRAGESVFDISASYPEYQNEIEESLSLVSELSSISTLSAPAPQRKHKYTEKAVTFSNLLTQWSFNMRFAVIPLSLLLVLVGGKFMMTATAHSLPGDKLYAVKRATETARLNLTQDQEKIALLHLELTQKRLDELKQAIDQDNTASSTAAVAALKDQAQKTLEIVPVIAENKAVNYKDQSILNNLVAINNEQKTLLAEMAPTDNPDIAMSILSITQSADASIANIMAKVAEPEAMAKDTTPDTTKENTTITTSAINESTPTTTNTTTIPAQPTEEPMVSVIAEPIEPQFEKP